MKKNSYYIIILVVAGLSIVSFWVYQKYFRQEKQNVLLFKVERGDIQETVKTRGEIVPLKDFDLEFPFSGIVEKIYVKENQSIDQNAPLIKLETTDFELETEKLLSNLIKTKANLNKLLAGAAKEEVAVYESKVSSALANLEDAKKNIVNAMLDAYTKSEDAVRAKADQFIDNPRTASPQLNFSTNDFQLENEIEQDRFFLENYLNAWKASLDKLTIKSDFSDYLAETNDNLSRIKAFLNKAALAINNPGNISLNSNISQTTFSTWQTNISTARTNINTAISNLTAAEEKLKTSQSNLEISESELAAKKAPARSEDIEIADSQIKEIESQIAISREKIKKSTLNSPTASKVLKINLEKGEVFKPGTSAVSLSSFGYKAQTDVSELEIGKIKEMNGGNAIIKLDAFPEQEIKGNIISIEPKEIVKDGDIYYRVNISLDSQNADIRSGMSADIVILGILKKNVLKISESAVYSKNGRKFAKIAENNDVNGLKEIEIKTGVSDGEFIEIIKGLKEGQTAIISAE